MENPMESLGTEKRRRAGHYEILGETYAKFEFFEHGWNPYSRFLDVDKIDVVLRRRLDGMPVYREAQVKYGKLFEVGQPWERALFDLTSWRFFREDEFDSYVQQGNFYVVLVLAAEVGYQGDIFIFPVGDFVRIVRMAIPTKGQRKVYISRLKDDPKRWILRRKNKFTVIDDESAVDVSTYRRNFDLLLQP